MPVALNVPEPLPPLIPPRKRWTRDECAMLVANGTWDQQRLELVGGELISKMGQNPPHVLFVNRLLQWLVGTLGWGRVFQDAPIDGAPGDNPVNEPEPDLLVLKQAAPGVGSGNFKPNELALVVAVSDRT